MTTSGRDDLLEIGRVVKPHGLRGEVIVELVTNRVERLAAGTVLDTDEGPLAIERSSPHHARWIVAFAGVHDRDAADRLRGTVLRAAPMDDPDVLWVHELIGAEVVDGHGKLRGIVASVEANPASDLLVLDTGALVPLHFVVEQRDGQVVVQAPEGLFDDAD